MLVALAVPVWGCDSSLALRARFALERMSGGPVRTLDAPGVPPVDLFLDPGSLAMTPFILEQGVWEPGETRLFLDTVEPGDVVVDIGANVGYFTLLAAASVGERGHVYAFEPDPFTFEILERNVRLNGFENVTLERKAVSSADGDTLLFYDEGIREDGRIYEPDEGVLADVLGRSLETRERVEVETVRLDTYFGQRAGEVDLVKIDTQGAEAAIVAGMHGVIADAPGIALIVEYVPRLLRDFGADPAELIRDLAKHDLRFHLIHPTVQSPQVEPVDPKSLEHRSLGAMLFLARGGAL